MGRQQHRQQGTNLGAKCWQGSVPLQGSLSPVRKWNRRMSKFPPPPPDRFPLPRRRHVGGGGIGGMVTDRSPRKRRKPASPSSESPFFSLQFPAQSSLKHYRKCHTPFSKNDLELSNSNVMVTVGRKEVWMVGNPRQETGSRGQWAGSTYKFQAPTRWEAGKAR